LNIDHMTWDDRHTKSFLNHFFTSKLIPSYSLSATFVYFALISERASNILALVLKAFATRHKDRLPHRRKGHAPGFSPVTFNPAVSFKTLASFFCSVTTTLTASQYSLRIFNRLSNDLQDLCTSVLSANGGGIWIGVAMLHRSPRRRSQGNRRRHDRGPCPGAPSFGRFIPTHKTRL
jgi:hypothetical protein